MVGSVVAFTWLREIMTSAGILGILEPGYPFRHFVLIY